MSARRVVPGAVVALAAAAAMLTGAPAALAATDSNWSGQSTTSSNWSDTGNWDNVPGSSTGTLAFPDLSTCDAGTAPAGAACYGTANKPLLDNAGPITASELTIGGAQQYVVAGSDPTTDTVTLNPGSNGVGLSAAPIDPSCLTSGVACTLNLANWKNVPIVLGSDQQWDVSGYGSVYLDTISGPHNLTFATNHGWLYANDVNTSSLAIQGSGEFQLDNNGAGRLPAVTVSNSTDGSQTGGALGVANHSATSGSITVNGTNNFLYVLDNSGPTETMLSVTGNVTLNNTSTVEFDIDGANTTPGTDASQLKDTGGTVNFGGAALSLWQATSAGTCTALTPGKTYTLVQGGTLTGPIQVGGSMISPGQTATEKLQSSTGCSSASTTTVVVNYTANAITATVGPVAPSVVSGEGPQISGGTTVGDQLKVDSNGTWVADPAPTYSYQWYACSGSACAPISGATGATYTLTDAELGKTVQVQVTATNSQGPGVANSNALGPVVTAPVAVAGKGPTITGGTTVGDKLTVSGNGSWTALPAAAYTYQWVACSGPTCTPIAGATASTYTLTSAEVGKMVKVVVTATNSLGSAQAASNAIGPVNVVVASKPPVKKTPLRVLVHRNLARLGHPHGRHAILLLARRGVFITRFHAPRAGRLSDVWTAFVRIHGKRHKLVVARAQMFVRGGHTVRVVVHLTPAGRFRLRHHVRLFTIAHERFFVRGLGWTSMVRRFRI